MSSKNLDDLFQENLNGRDFKPSDAGWANMEQMLDDQRLDALFADKLGSRPFTATRSGWKKAAAMLSNPGIGVWSVQGMRIAAGIASAIAIAGIGYMTLGDVSMEAIYEPRTGAPGEFANNLTIENNSSSDFELDQFSENSSEAASDNENTVDATEGENLYSGQGTATSITSTAPAYSSATGTTVNEDKTTSSGGARFSNPLLANAYSGTEQGVRLAALDANLLINNNDLSNDLSPAQNGFVYLDSYKKPKPVIKHRLGILGGLNLARGFESGTNAGDLSANIFGGVSYNYFIHPKWVLHADLLYQARTGIETAKVLQSKTYNFGSSKDVLTMHNERLHYIELPVHLGYHITQKVQLLAGINLAYLAGCSNEMVHEHDSPFESWTKTTAENSIPEGMNRIDLGLSAGIAYEFTPAIEFGARMNYGLTDVTDNDYFSSSTIDRNLQMRFHLAYRFLRF
jgi:hypothetical protein